MIKGNSILVTGAAGFVGSHACRYFVEQGYEVIAIIRNKTTDTTIVPQTIKCDMLNKDQVEQILKQYQPNLILHLAGQNHVQKSWDSPCETIETNVLPTLYLLDAVRKYSSKSRVIVTGSVLTSNHSTLLPPSHPYEVSKVIQVLTSQSWGSLYNLDVIITKLTNLIGPGLSKGVCSIFAEKIVDIENGKTEKHLEVNHLDAQRDFLDVRDAINAFDLIFQKGQKGGVYEIGSGKIRTLEDVVNTFKKYSRTEFTYSGKSKISEPLVEINTDSIQSLGWKQNISFEKSLQNILTFFRKRI